MLRKLLTSVILISSLSPNAVAQYQQQSILSSQSGQTLINSLKNQYKPVVTLDYGMARDTLYKKIYSVDNDVSCVYTGYTLNLGSGDPSTTIYKNGSSMGITAEHTYPQSKGAQYGHAKSDMHHLYPVRAGVNSARNNHPYGEVNDNNADFWYKDGVALTSKPSQEEEQYSEFDSHGLLFEPREDHKGNAARAIFYFYTMYKPEADNADPSFFAQMLPDLCDWHQADPVDSLEWMRNQKISTYQGGKVNPFILDCTLAQRSYCPNSTACFVDINKRSSWGLELSPIFPNPSHTRAELNYELHRDQKVILRLYNSVGQLILEEQKGQLNAGNYSWEIDRGALPKGLYICQITLIQQEQQQSFSQKLIFID